MVSGSTHNLSVYFNPRSREGSDTNLMDLITETADFNPRSREGSDLIPPVAANA